MTADLLSSGADVAAIVARHYDELDVFYRDIWGEHVHHGLWRTGEESPLEAAERLVDHVASALALQPGARVIDVGAGYGGTARRLASHLGARVTGFTVSAAQHAYAERVYGNGEAGIQLLLRDWLANELPSARADAVVAIESTEHMADLSHALAEMHRVLRPGGRVAVCAWLASESTSPWAHRWLLEPLMREGRLVTLATATEYARQLGQAGFADVTFQDLSSTVARTWTVCLRRLVARVVSDARYLRYALDSESNERRFLAGMLRIVAAYASGAMRYGLFTGTARA